MASFITTLNTSLLSSSSSIPLFRTKPRSGILLFTQSSCGFSQFRMMNQQNFLQKQEHKKKKKRGLLMVTRGAPSTNTLILAFVFPLSLLLATIFAALKIADKLDQDFLEEKWVIMVVFQFVPSAKKLAEFINDASVITALNTAVLAINQAIREGKDEDEEEKSPTLPVEEKPALPRTRNRPKRLG